MVLLFATLVFVIYFVFILCPIESETPSPELLYAFLAFWLMWMASLCHNRKISINSPKGHSTLTYRKFKNFDSARFCYDISTQDWDQVNNSDDPNVMWDIWKKIFFLCVDKHAPLRTKRIRTSKSPWITPQLKKKECITKMSSKSKPFVLEMQVTG